MLILNAAEVRQAFPMREAIEAMREAFAAFSDGRALNPPRMQLPVSRQAGVTLIMPAFVDDTDPQSQALAVKVVSIFNNNHVVGLASVQSAVLVLDPATGRPTALIEGATLTAIRTAAASGLATELLARRESRRLAIFGAGAEARTHLDAMCAVRPIEQVRIYSPKSEESAALVAEFTGRPGFDVRLEVAATPKKVMEGADIICCATSSKVPVFEDVDVRPGGHINAIGSYTRAVSEVPAETVRRAMVVVDSYDAAWQDAGELLQPLDAGLIGRNHIQAEVGEIVLGRRPGRTDDRQITLFKSVGLAVQDAFAASSVTANARRLKLGYEYEW